MIKILVSLLFPMSVFAATTGWKTIASTVNCEKKVSILAQEGSRVIYAVEDGKKHALYPEGDFVFKRESPVDLVYDSYNGKENPPAKTRYLYTHQSNAKKGNPVMKIHSEGERVTCDLKLKG